MGKKAKEHRKKVVKRNQRIAIEKKQFQKTYNELMKMKFDELAKNFNEIEGAEVVDMIENGVSVMEKSEEVEDATIVDETLPDQEG
jgi:hypothetical protein